MRTSTCCQGAPLRSWHPLFRNALDQSAFVVEAEEDITDAVAPSIDLEQALFNVIGHGVSRVSGEIKAKKPGAHWTLTRFVNLFLSARKRRNLMQDENIVFHHVTQAGEALND